ncbi:hypothetical protein [Seonamhaeicola marinus]|uniref:STAS domain-containing protein n=1 Tax=Seonamhaeicola marinus TaxID=1912246 RepID=A0A5D0HI48_9FLAO|nr:hypothetical protein [Seonamhaeicola marinus]TYA69949.1 hypothetical protein FUA24_21910 [Seonamhaeicola marinus]
MELKITNCNNFFKIKGILDKKSISLFEEEFNNIFDRMDNLKVSIEAVDSMDRHGIMALTRLHEEALMRNKKLSIIGYGCKNLLAEFKATAAA